MQNSMYYNKNRYKRYKHVKGNLKMFVYPLFYTIFNWTFYYYFTFNYNDNRSDFYYNNSNFLYFNLWWL